ncbi:hypothetical protein [Nevskia sp.]|uniref:hypothetical protein n=1 Tax=Nevskia sp. TaxID=1929292 RepID=UPI0025E9C044|nr:hypothetical protein [Nevskia sp.]
MTSKKIATKAPKKASGDPEVNKMPAEKGETPESHTARAALSLQTQATIAIDCVLSPSFGPMDANVIRSELVSRSKQVIGGDLSSVELMLFNQAQVLQSIFTRMVCRGSVDANSRESTESYLRLAFKAQGQCRATLETLANIKNPQPTSFIRQQNIAANQQVNNGAALPAAVSHARTEDSGDPANELKAMTNEQGQRLDPETSAAAGGSHPAMATLAASHRA